MTTPTVESYCEAIYELHEDNAEAIQARLADRLGISRASVSGMTRRLREDGLLTLDGDVLRLTEAGTVVAETVVRRHRLAERFLTDVLGLSWAEAHHEAGRWEHVFTDTVEQAMTKLLGAPTTCPHGNPIPGSSYAAPDALPLKTFGVGQHFSVTRVTEELEFVPGMLEFLESIDVRPGRDGTVEALSPDGTMTLRIGDRSVGLSAFAAGRILAAEPAAIAS